jgi:hypothetical protein
VISRATLVARQEVHLEAIKLMSSSTVTSSPGDDSDGSMWEFPGDELFDSVGLASYQDGKLGRRDGVRLLWKRSMNWVASV